MAFDPIAAPAERTQKVTALQERWRGVRQENEQLRKEIEQLTRKSEHRAISKPMVQKIADQFSEGDSAHSSAESNQPATEPTTLAGNRSAGRTMTRVDQDCWPK